MISKSVRGWEIIGIWRDIFSWIKQDSVPDLSIPPQRDGKKEEPVSYLVLYVIN